MEFSTNGSSTKVAGNKSFGKVIQFSVFFGDQIGFQNPIFRIFHATDVSVLAFSFLENFDGSIMRFVVNYPSIAKNILSEKNLQFSTNSIVAVEINSVQDVSKISNIMFAAEIRTHYMYPFLSRPNGKMGIAIQTENNGFTSDILSHAGIRIISQEDIGR